MTHVSSTIYNEEELQEEEVQEEELKSSIFPTRIIPIPDEEKISDVPQDVQIKLDENTIFRFSSEVRNNCLFLKLTEIGAFCPHFYEQMLTLDKIREIHKMFRACDNLQEVKEYLDILFKKKKFKLTKENDKTLTLEITGYLLSSIETFKIECDMKITTFKDDSLMILYNIEKRQIKMWKELEQYVNSLGSNGKSFLSKMKEIEQKYK